MTQQIPLTTILAGVWREKPGLFWQNLAELGNAEDPVTMPKLSEFLAAPPSSVDERWCLLALLTRDEVLLRGVDWRVERRKAWRLLMQPEEFPRFLDALNSVQAAAGEAILLEYVLESLPLAAVNSPRPPYWETFCAWLIRRGRLESKVLERIETTLAQLGGSTAQDAWPRLQILAYQAGLAGVALRLHFSQILPVLSRADAVEKTKAAIRWWLEKGAEYDAAIAPLLGRLEVASEALPILGDWLADQLADNGEQAYRRVIRILRRTKDLSLEAGPACGRFLERLALTRFADRAPAVLHRCLKALSNREENHRDEFVGAALGQAAAALIPVLEGSCHIRDLGLYVQAVASLLEARNGQRATAAADAELLHLAVLGRILAEEAGACQVGRKAVESLDLRWLAFLRATRVLEFLATEEAASSGENLMRVEEWLNLLQDEIAADPPLQANDDPRFELFIRLAWWRWVAGGSSLGRASVSAKLRLVRAWGKIPASTNWLRLQMEEQVPRQLWNKALPLLPQQPSLVEKLLGGRR